MSKNHLKKLAFCCALSAQASLLSACTLADKFGLSQTIMEGYVLNQDALSSISVGSSKEQVLLALGTPSTTAIYDHEVFYYISQKRYRPVGFMLSRVTDRKVLAIYFGKNGRITHISHYGLRDGRVFDFLSQKTPVLGADKNFITQLISTKLLPSMGQQRHTF